MCAYWCWERDEWLLHWWHLLKVSFHVSRYCKGQSLENKQAKTNKQQMLLSIEVKGAEYIRINWKAGTWLNFQFDAHSTNSMNSTVDKEEAIRTSFFFLLNYPIFGQYPQMALSQKFPIYTSTSTSALVFASTAVKCQRKSQDWLTLTSASGWRYIWSVALDLKLQAVKNARTLSGALSCIATPALRRTYRQ